jgi:hypothetical protein
MLSGMWKGIVGLGYTAEDFAAYAAQITLGGWKPSMIVLHNTAAPRLDQWHSTPGPARMQNLQHFYRDVQGWSGGPHLFIADDLIWCFTPLTAPGVHSPSWNEISWGVELVGDYDSEPFGDAVRANAVSALATLHRLAGIDPAGMRLHGEDPETTHKHCPGVNVSSQKAALIAAVAAAMSGANAATQA